MSTGRVIGIGGVFFKSNENKQLGAWYSQNLGIEGDSCGAHFKWRAFDRPEVERLTTWSVCLPPTPPTSIPARSPHRSETRGLRLRSLRLDLRSRRQQDRTLGTAGRRL